MITTKLPCTVTVGVVGFVAGTITGLAALTGADGIELTMDRNFGI